MSFFLTIYNHTFLKRSSEKMELEIEEGLSLNHRKSVHYDGVPAVDCNSVTYNDFFKDYIMKNRPCVVKNVGREWRASKEWVRSGKPDLGHFRRQYGGLSVMVYNCDERYYNSQKTETMTVEDYSSYWKKRSEVSVKYLKDWHLRRKTEDDSFYDVPLLFSSDWLNEYLCENSMDDYRFVYVGPKGSWTPFHADVFTSYSWSTNICGRKRWLFFPPGEEDRLRDTFNNLPYNIVDPPLESTCFEIIQNAHEAIFVPSRWHHQVWNLEDTISINHNWINACNIKTVWMSLKGTLKDVYKEISDCKEMDDFAGHCRAILKSTFGMDFVDFYRLISYVALKRIDLLQKNAPVITSDGKTLGRNHARFDLRAIRIVLELLHNDNDNDNDLGKSGEFENLQDLLDKLNAVLDNTDKN